MWRWNSPERLPSMWNIGPPPIRRCARHAQQILDAYRDVRDHLNAITERFGI